MRRIMPVRIAVADVAAAAADDDDDNNDEDEILASFSLVFLSSKHKHTFEDLAGSQTSVRTDRPSEKGGRSGRVNSKF